MKLIYTNHIIYKIARNDKCIITKSHRSIKRNKKTPSRMLFVGILRATNKFNQK